MQKEKLTKKVEEKCLMTVSINKKVFDILSKYCKEEGYSRSGFVEKVLKDKLKELKLMD